MHKEKGVVGGLSDLIRFFRNGLYFLFFTCIFIFRILILYTTDFNLRINKDIIIIINYICSFHEIWIKLLSHVLIPIFLSK